MNDIQSQLIAKIVAPGVDETLLKEALSVFDSRNQKITKEIPQDFMSEVQTCKFCGGISRSTLWHWRNAGLKSYQVGGRRLFLAEDVKKFIVAQTYTGKNQEVCHE